MEQIIQIQHINKLELKSMMEDVIDDKLSSLKKGDTEKNITVQTCAELLNVSEQSVWNYIKRGLIPAKKVGRKYLINQRDLENALKEVKSLKYRRD